MFLWSLVVVGVVDLLSLHVLMEPGCCGCCRAVVLTCSYGAWLLWVL